MPLITILFKSQKLGSMLSLLDRVQAFSDGVAKLCIILNSMGLRLADCASRLVLRNVLYQSIVLLSNLFASTACECLVNWQKKSPILPKR